MSGKEIVSKRVLNISGDKFSAMIFAFSFLASLANMDFAKNK